MYLDIYRPTKKIKNIPLVARCGFIKEAVHYFRRSLNVDPNFIQAARNIDNAINLAVERWHFRMLNDSNRNEVFRRAILKKISCGFDRVLDIGTGSGLLSLFCVEGNAKEIYACDSSAAMIEIAGEVLRENGAAGVKLIGKHSTELEIPEDMPRRVSLVVTETADAGLLGERILFTVADAWKNLLLPPRGGPHDLRPEGEFGFVIPYAADVYIAGIECDDIYKDSHLNASLLDLKNCNCIRNCDNYDTRNLKQVQFKFVTNIRKMIRINFNEVEFLREVIEGRRAEDLSLRCTRAGRLDCFAVWFNLNVDEEISLSTDPREETNSAWDQAIFFPPRCVPLKEGQEIPLRVSFEGGKINLKCLENADGNFEPSEDAIRILNDENLVKGFGQARGKLLEIYNRPIKILDCYPFPVLGLNLLAARDKSLDDELVCVVPSPKDRDLVDFLSKQYGINKVTIIEELNIEKCMEEKQKFDVILVNLFETSGELKDGVVFQLQDLRSLLKPEGRILPESVTVYGQLVYSDWLLKTSKVISDDVTCGYKIADFINLYQTRHFIDLDSNAMEKIACSEAFPLFSLDSPETSSQILVDTSSAAPAPNAIIYWFKMRFTKECDDVVTNSTSSFCRQAGFMFQEVKASHMFKLKVVRHNGLFNVELIQEETFN